MQIDMSRFRDAFFQEADEHIAAMEGGLLRLEEDAHDVEVLNSIFRGAHSIKGAAGSFGFDAIVRFTHSMESLLDRMREGALPATVQRVDALLRSVDVLRGLLAAARSGDGAPADTEAVLTLVIAAQRANFDGSHSGRVREQDLQARAIYAVRFRPSARVFQQGMDPVLVLRQLSKIGEVLEVAVDTAAMPPLAELEPDVCHLAWHMRFASDRRPEEIRDVFAFVEDGAGISIEPERLAARTPEPSRADLPARDSSSIRVATEKVDRLIDLVGELVIAESMTAQLLNHFTPASLPALQLAFAEMERYTRELQERVMAVRMLPIGNAFSRMPRLLRDLASATGKRIELEMLGEDTELDKGVVERMIDPLTHLIRNAADHGIETPEERRSAGKPEYGTIRLQAYHQGGNVIVEVADDGRGLDLDRIRNRAVERGIIDAAGEITNDEICALIFEPGLSTAAAISDVSGRGVGMDVVKRNVEGLNGAVRVLSEPGAGTRVEIKLPLTLAILDGLLLKVGTHTYILPLVAILESIRPRREQLNSMAGRGEVVVLRNEAIPLVRLHRIFGIATEITAADRGLAVIVEHQGRRLALLVDELLGQQQVVIKSLETHFHKVDAVLGATILGDGHPALILDVPSLAQLARASTSPAAA